MGEVCGNCQWWANLHPSARAGECCVQRVGIQRLRPIRFADQECCDKFVTSKLHIAELRISAEDRCDGCRLSWRLKGWMHGEPMPIECNAKKERQALRDIGRGGGVETKETSNG